MIAHKYPPAARAQTGSIFTSDVRPTADGASGVRDDPFFYAELGGEAK